MSNQQTMQLADIFQSTLSMRRATESEGGSVVDGHISIHALHEESDTVIMSKRNNAKFQSTLSMRRATGFIVHYHSFHIFQSTLSMRRATRCGGRCASAHAISIHALHEESD